VFLLYAETKQDLLKTRPDFLKTFDDLSTKLNGILFYFEILIKFKRKTFPINLATNKELAELKTMARNFSTEFESKF
jgi:hypothetical protein